MLKVLLQISVIVASAVSSCSFADTKPPSIGGIPIPNPANSPQVMSGDQYKSKVDTLSKETTNNLNQTVQSQIKSSAPGSTQAPPSSGASQSTTPSSTPENQQEQDNTGATPQAAAPTGGYNTTAKNPASSNSQENNADNTPQTYTGFGGGQSNQKSNNAGGNQNSKSSGFNMGY